MARIVGTSFKPGMPARQQRQETAMDRALASFVSPQGVYLLAQGIGALGKLPWQSKEGGLGLMKQAAQKRNEEAQGVLRQAEALNKDIKPGFTAKEVQIQRDAVMPYEAEEMADPASTYGNAKLRQELLAQGQREGESPAEFKARFEGKKRFLGADVPAYRTEADAEEERRLRTALETDIGKPEDRAVTAQGARMEAMIKAAEEAGRDVDKVDLPMMDEASLRSKLEFAFKDAEVSAEDLQDLSMEELMDQAVSAQTANRDLRSTSQAIQNMFSQQLDPFLVQQNVEASVKRRQEYNQRVRAELKRRAASIQESSPTKFVEGRIAKQLAGLDPVEQRAELRRLAKSVRTQEDKDEVLSLASRFKPVRSTVGDYFTSDDDLRTEFEDELGELLPTIDPLFDLKRQKLEAEVGVLTATKTELSERNSFKLAMEIVRGEAATATALGKEADKLAAKSKAAREKQDKKLEGIKKALARTLNGFPTHQLRLLRDADNIINSRGNFRSKYNRIYALTQTYAKPIKDAGAVAKFMADQARSTAEKTAKELEKQRKEGPSE